MTVEVVNFGCRLNIAEGEAIRRAAGDAGPLTVINSCAVTSEAVSKARHAVRRAARARPGAHILVTGCAAQIEPETFAAMPEVTGVIGNREKKLTASYAPFVPSPSTSPGFEAPGSDQRASSTLGTNSLKVNVSDIFEPARLVHPVVSGRDHARAFVEVQTGCDHRCTFCVIPYGRGNSASAQADEIIAAIGAVVDAGQQEVVLTGVDLTSYDGGLAPLVSQILRDVPALPRLRLSSLDPSEVDEALFDLIVHEPRIMPHIHLSLQAGDDMILKRMKRRHSRAQAVDLVQRLKAARPEIAIGADVIAGFPTEDDAMFANSAALIDDCDIVFAHIFPYSPRAGTPAARMPQVPGQVARSRAAILRERAADRRARWLSSLVGTMQAVLVERDGMSGHAANFAPVRFAMETPLNIALIEVTSSDGEKLYGHAPC
jgi:threonylcarbamoyladenosine tRNA methylthiotransferase MtaB